MTTIGCDLDGVLADTSEEIGRRISEYFGVPQSEVKNDKFYMHDRFDIDPKEMQEFLNGPGCFGDPTLWANALPIEHNIQALGKASWFYGMKVVIITGRHQTARAATEEWLRDNNIHYKFLLMETLQAKHRALKYAGCDLLIEDRYEEALTCARKGFESWLIRTDYNRHHEGYNTDVPLYWADGVRDIVDNLRKR